VNRAVEDTQALPIRFATRAGLTIREAPYQRKAGALFSYAKPGSLFFQKKVDDLFLVVVMFKRTLNVFLSNVKTAKNSVVKIWQLIGGAPLRRGPPPMVQPAQCLIRPCSRLWRYTNLLLDIGY